MKNLLSLVLLLSIFSHGFAQESGSDFNGPKFKFEETTIDYGKILKGSDGERVFKFTNIGNAPLLIEKVASSCGCTVPEKPESPVMPGESADIKVKYDTKRMGRISKTIYVFSNDSEQPRFQLKIRGEVVKELPEEDTEKDGRD